MSLAAAIVQSWRAPRRVLRGLLAQDRREGRLLMYLTLALGLVFVAQWPRLAREATAEIGFDARLAGALFGIMFLGPLLAYGIGLLLTLLLRLAAPVEGYAVRLALFWALLGSAPLVLAQAALVAVAGAQGPVALVSGLVALGLFVVILLAGLRVALEAAARPA
jgi:hypothetical protein